MQCGKRDCMDFTNYVCITTNVEPVSSVETPTSAWHQRPSVLSYIRRQVTTRLTVTFSNSEKYIGYKKIQVMNARRVLFSARLRRVTARHVPTFRKNTVPPSRWVNDNDDDDDDEGSTFHCNVDKLLSHGVTLHSTENFSQRCENPKSHIM